MKKFSFFLLFFFLFFPNFTKAQDFDFKVPFSIPGRIEGKGNYFEIKDSNYLNVILESEKKIEVVLESIPRMISLNIGSSTEATTTLTIKGLEPNKKYFKYEDTHKNETEFFSDENGNYFWIQDLTKPHYIWIQEKKGTIFLPEDCETYGKWDEATRTCTLTQNVTTSVEITTSSITLDCDGNSIVNGYIFEEENKDYENYKCFISYFDHGILVLDKREVTIKNCKISNFCMGIRITNSHNNTLIGNDVSFNNTGIITDWSSNNKLESNEAKNNCWGILIEGSENSLKNNIMENNRFNFGDRSLNNFVEESNLVDGKPIYYWVEKNNLEVPKDAGVVILINCSNIIVQDLTIKNNHTGILLFNTTGSLVEGNDLENNLYGLGLFSSNSNFVISNNVNKNFFGIEIQNSSKNLLKRNNVLNNGSNTYGGYGISLARSSENFLIENNIAQNNIRDTAGIWLYNSYSNYIYHNNFINNSYQISSDGWPNFFDNGYPSGGNYWSDYSVGDEKSGRNQDQDGSDGIGDVPYKFYGGQDNYPFFRENGWILPKVLISEVYYDVAKDKGKERDNEWVIIHNLEENSIDLAGWQICDNERCDNIPTSSIPANGFAIITPTSTTFSFWWIPKDMIKIVLGSKFGSQGLSNDGDRVILKDKEGRIVDAMSYGDDKSIFDPPCQDVAEGKSLLRDPPEKDTDTCEDFKESEPTIGKNRPPIPIINFSPKNPVKEVKVKFDASSSTDPDGEIVKFEWQIASTTFSGTTTEFTFNENGEYQITLTATDNDGVTSSTSTTITVKPFSFAIITDLHIGRHYQEEYEGQDYYLTERLKNVVKWINDNKDSVKCGENATCSIKFLAVLGDITENTPLIGFCKVKETLDQLQIPYVPVFGNHDVGTDEEYASSSRWVDQDYFDQVFWSTSSIPCQNASSAKNFELLLNELNFQRDAANTDYKNFSFSFGGINFIGLDFVSREPFMKFGKGVGADAVLNERNKGWLEKKLEEFKGEPVILLAHHPLIFDPINAFSFTEFPHIENLLKDNITVFFDFAGHIHSFEEWHGKGWWVANANKKYTPIAFTNVLTTEALMVGSNGRGVEEETEENGVVNGKKGIIRIVKVSEKNEIKPNNWETTETGDEFLAFNPSLNLGFSIRRQFNNIPCMELEAYKFSEKPCNFIWDFGGETSFIDCNSDYSECLVCYKKAGQYLITLSAKDKNSTSTEEISKKIVLNEAIIPRAIKKSAGLIEKGIEFISEKAQMSFDKIGQVVKDKVRIFKRKSPAVPVGEITIHFENLSEDLDLTGLITDTDFKKQKTILYMESWPNVIERSKVLFLPKK